jgi:hypothetical protein
LSNFLNLGTAAVLQIQERPVPQLKENEVLILEKAAGVLNNVILQFMLICSDTILEKAKQDCSAGFYFEIIRHY